MGMLLSFHHKKKKKKKKNHFCEEKTYSRNLRHRGFILWEVHGPIPHRGGHITRGRAVPDNGYTESSHLMRIGGVVEGIKY